MDLLEEHPLTEQDWLASDDPVPMLAALTQASKDGWGRPSFPLVSDRKLRLFACACSRQVWHLLTDDRSRLAVETAERYADNLATARDMTLARNRAFGTLLRPPGDDFGADAAAAEAYST